MDAKTLEALKGSIAKWERNAVAEKPEDYLVSPEDCPLCTLFFDDGCVDCPVAEKTGEPFCEGSPYYKAAAARNRWYFREGRRATALKAADEEGAFLKSLLPVESA